MAREKKIESEHDVKEKLVKPWFDTLGAWHYAPIQTGMGEHGVHDRIGCVPLEITPEMVGKTLGVFVSVEAKRPGRRNEQDRGMSRHQKEHMDAINAAGGFSSVVDSAEDLSALWYAITRFRRVHNV